LGNVIEIRRCTLMTPEISPGMQKRLDILKKLDTKALQERLKQLEDELFSALMDQATTYYDNYDYTSSRGGDCARVKEIEAELLPQCPELNQEGKKVTVADKEAWLTRQRVESADLKAVIQKQREVAFQLESVEITAKLVKEQLSSARGALALKTAQIQFLSGGE